MHTEGGCPGRGQRRWAIKANLENALYEDERYLFSLHNCQMTLGNTEDGALLDQSAAELRGTAVCSLGKLGGELNALIRFNVLSGTGSTKIQPG